jgi:hypothetical protein
MQWPCHSEIFVNWLFQSGTWRFGTTDTEILVTWSNSYPRICFIKMLRGCSISEAVSRRLPTAVARFDPRSGHTRFVVDKVAMGQVSSKYFSFPCQFSFHIHPHHHLSSGAGTIGQIVANVPSGLSLTPSQKIKKKMLQKPGYNYEVDHYLSPSWEAAYCAATQELPSILWKP